MKLPILGGCFCGSIRYEIVQPPKRMGICYCRSCQHATGSAFFPYIAVLQESLNINGSITWFESKGHSGSKINRGFCAKCGSTLFGKPDALPHIRTISAASLDNFVEYKPEIAVWIDDAPLWCHIDPSLKQFNKNPF